MANDSLNCSQANPVGVEANRHRVPNAVGTGLIYPHRCQALKPNKA